MSDHLSRFGAMRLLMEELSPEEADRAHGHVGECAACSSLLDELRSVQSEGAQLAARAPLPAPVPWWRAALTGWRLPAFAATAAVGALLLVWLPGTSSRYRAKGGLRVETTCKLGERVWRCESGERLSPGVAIELRAHLPDDGYLLVLGIDGTGTRTTYFPTGSDRAGPVAKTDQLLPGSLVLDDSPGPERFFVVWSRAPFLSREVGGLGPGEPLDPPPESELVEVRFEK